MILHPSGKLIKLDKKYHRYFIKGENRNFISVTQFLNKYFPKFKRREVAKKYAEKHGLNWKHVEAEWIKLGEDASERGDKYHKFSEKIYDNYIKGEYSSTIFGFGKDKIERRMEKILLNLYKEYTPLQPESIVASLKYNIAGSMDLLMLSYYDKDNIIIADWKFVKKIKEKNEWEKAYYPIQHLDNCNYYKFCLQLNLYSYIIKEEGYFEKHKNHDMYIFHIKEDDVVSVKVPDMQSDIKNMILDWRRK